MKDTGRTRGKNKGVVCQISKHHLALVYLHNFKPLYYYEMNIDYFLYKYDSQSISVLLHKRSLSFTKYHDSSKQTIEFY